MPAGTSPPPTIAIINTTLYILRPPHTGGNRSLRYLQAPAGLNLFPTPASPSRAPGADRSESTSQSERTLSPEGVLRSFRLRKGGRSGVPEHIVNPGEMGVNES